MQNTTSQLCKSITCFLTSNWNNLHLKQVLQGWKTRAEIDIGNTIEYDVKSYQVKVIILNCAYVQLKVLIILTTNRRDAGIANMFLT